MPPVHPAATPSRAGDDDVGHAIAMDEEEEEAMAILDGGESGPSVESRSVPDMMLRSVVTECTLMARYEHNYFCLWMQVGISFLSQLTLLFLSRFSHCWLLPV